MKKTYSSTKYDRKIKSIKKLIRKHDELAIFNACINYMYAPVNDEIEHIKRHPWLIMLLIKWAFIDQKKIIYRRDTLNNKNFNDLLQSIYDLGNLIQMPTEYSHSNLFMRNMAYQQFIYQSSFSMTEFSRQFLLFGNLQDNHTLKVNFYNKYGINFNNFLELSFAIIAYFLDRKNHTIDLSWFEPLFPKYNQNMIKRFLDLISIEIRKLHRTLATLNMPKGGNNEYYEQTPFINYPLVKHDEKYTCIHPYILYRCIETFIYDRMKKDNSEKFMNYFGKIFEKYLLHGLKYSELPFVNESDLKKHITSGIKCVDYLVIEDASNIFIDAKAVEMPYLGKVSDNPEIIFQKVKKNVVKAIQQAYELNDFLLTTDNAKLPQFKEKSFLLVVTYKELYLGNGITVYESLAKEFINKIKENIASKAIIPLSHIYFITIEDFDLLMSLKKNYDISITSVIEKAISEDKNTKTKKFIFSQHIDSMQNSIKKVDYLQKVTSEIVEKYSLLLE